MNTLTRPAQAAADKNQEGVLFIELLSSVDSVSYGEFRLLRPIKNENQLISCGSAICLAKIQS